MCENRAVLLLPCQEILLASSVDLAKEWWRGEHVLSDAAVYLSEVTNVLGFRTTLYFLVGCL